MTTNRVEEASAALERIRGHYQLKLDAQDKEAIKFIQALEGSLELVKAADELQSEQIGALRDEFDRYDELHKNGQLTDSLRVRRTTIYWVLDEYVNHSKYRELLQTATSLESKKRQSEAKIAKLPKYFFKIERIFAQSGAVHLQDRDGKLHTLPLKEACTRGLALQQMLKDPNVPQWHRKRIYRIVDDLTKACIAAKNQLDDKENVGANLIREVFEGVDAEGAPLEIVVDDRMVHSLSQEYPSVTEDEIVRVMKQKMPHGMHTYAARTDLLKRLHDSRVREGGVLDFAEAPGALTLL